MIIPQPMRRTRFIHSRVSEQEKKLMRKAAQKCGLTISAFLYEAAMNAAAKAGVFAGHTHQQTERH